MGPCQGGRCLVAIVDIVASELDESVDSIGKREQDSTFGVGTVLPDALSPIDIVFDDVIFERPRASYCIPGLRSAEVYSARSAIELMAHNGLLPGENVAI